MTRAIQITVALALAFAGGTLFGAVTFPRDEHYVETPESPCAVWKAKVDTLNQYTDRRDGR